jgi:hypothetical protein
MVPTCTEKQLNKKKKKKKKGAKTPLWPRLSDGAHLHPKKNPQNKEKDGELKLPFYRNLVMVPQKQQNK